MTTLAQQYVKVKVEEGVALVTLDHAPVNALSSPVMTELNATIDELNANDEVKVLVITGNGMAFVAGADINEIGGLTDAASAKELVMGGQGVFNKIEGLHKPVIAAINGFCLGGGMELAMACHMRIISDRARMGQPEINLGVIPGFGGTQRLPRIVGWAKATELILTADQLTAQEAYRIGLVNKVVPEGDVVKQAMMLAKKIANFGGLAIQATMKALEFGAANELPSSLEKEAELFAGLVGSNDMKEGVGAFLGKRRPNFSKTMKG